MHDCTFNELPDDVNCSIAICADDTTLCSNCNQEFNWWQQLELDSQLESDIRDTEDCDLLIPMPEKLNWFGLTGLIKLVVLM